MRHIRPGAKGASAVAVVSIIRATNHGDLCVPRPGCALSNKVDGVERILQKCPFTRRPI